VGCGFSGETARRLAEAGVQWIDVAGAGGTSWTGIESHRGAAKNLAAAFWDWGLPTAEAVREAAAVPGVRVIASGGVRNGVDAAKALALGAALAGAALPLLRALGPAAGPARLCRLLAEWRTEFSTVMFLTGSRGAADLRREGVLRRAGV
jgi:isopentenyl-diphosphate delta-isomerase